MDARQIETATSRWVREAQAFPPAEAAKLLRRKARFVAQQIDKRAGDAWALNVAHGALVAAAHRLGA